MGKNKSTRNVTIRLTHEDVALLDEITAENPGWTRHALLVNFVHTKCEDVRGQRKTKALTGK